MGKETDKATRRNGFFRDAFFPARNDKWTKLFLVGFFSLCVFGFVVVLEKETDGSLVYPIYTSFRDVPGVTDEEVAAIEDLQKRRKGFVYAVTLSTEAFYESSGDIGGYSALFCEWLSTLFGIPFKPTIYKWDDLMDAMESLEADFSGEISTTEERRERYFMTGDIAERSVKYMRLAGGERMFTIAKYRPLRFGFLRNTITLELVSPFIEEKFEIFFVNNYEEAYNSLKSGQIDAFFGSSVAEAAFEFYDNVTVADFFPFIYNPVSMATRNPELQPIVSVVQRALENEAFYYLIQLYNQGYRDYLRHKLFVHLTQEEQLYILEHSSSDNAIPFAATYDNYPVSFYNEREKEWQGIAFDVIREIEEITGLRFVPAHHLPIEWTVLLRILEKGEAAMITELIRTREREERFLWANNSFQTDYYALLSNSRYKNVTAHEVLYSKVGIIDATAYAEFFRNWFPSHTNTLVYSNAIEVFNALERGDVDLVMATRNLLLSVTNYMERPGFKINLQFGRPYASTFGFNVREEVLRSIVDKALPLIDTAVITGRWTRRVFDYKSKILEARIPWLVGLAITLFCVIVLLTLALLARLQTEKHLKVMLRERRKDLEAHEVFQDKI
ncbi:MAG: transporter substrate-binding domain-containing protein [Synergistaceae bacterium]|jgi:ABC-type amino acid transport substrate-binding protein|nr:transporter substrate-binding domain-containing protein [Synergistaceae bacterium]